MSVTRNGANPSSKTILSYGDVLLRQSDLLLLTQSKSSWLNDTLIGFYFEYLSKEIFPLNSSTKSTRLKFFSPEVTQCIKLQDPVEIFIDTSDGELNSFDCLFWPVNNSNETESYDSGTHWSLVIYYKLDNTFYNVDSSPGLNSCAARALYEKLKVLFNPEPTFKKLLCPSQVNGYDCGLHVLINAQVIGEHITEGNQQMDPNLVEKATPSKAQQMRNQLVQLIQTKSKSSQL